MDARPLFRRQEGHRHNCLRQQGSPDSQQRLGSSWLSPRSCRFEGLAARVRLSRVGGGPKRISRSVSLDIGPRQPNHDCACSGQRPSLRFLGLRQMPSKGNRAISSGALQGNANSSRRLSHDASRCNWRRCSPARLSCRLGRHMLGEEHLLSCIMERLTSPGTITRRTLVRSRPSTVLCLVKIAESIGLILAEVPHSPISSCKVVTYPHSTTAPNRCTCWLMDSPEQIHGSPPLASSPCSVHHPEPLLRHAVGLLWLRYRSSPQRASLQ